MRSQTLALILSAAVAVSAVPAKMMKRDWINDNNGNIKLFFSDDKTKIGTVTIDTIVDGLAGACSTEGTCDTGDMTFNGQLIAAGYGGSVDDITVTVSPNGAYPTWIHNGLIDALRAAVHAVSDCQDISHTSTCPNPAVYCPGSEPMTYNECTVPRYWGINYQAPDAADAAPPNINANVVMQIDGDGFCSTFTTVGSAVAGAVNGVAGGIFTLIGLACTA